MIVYVIDGNNCPLMPCSPRTARLLLKDGKARVKRRTPFTIKLKYCFINPDVKPLTLGVDIGSDKIGSAVIDPDGNVLYASEVQIRNDITTKMDRRKMYRVNRRSRKTRYRPARWLNRKNSNKSGRFSPTIVSKINAHLREMNFVYKLLPITKIILEVANFDPHALKNPAVLKYKWLYLRGINYGFANTRAYVLHRDGYLCQNCRSKLKNITLDCHHIIFRSNGGSDDESNLIVLCRICHDKLHANLIKLRKPGKLKSTLKHATQMNSISKQLSEWIPEADTTFGFVTKEHRFLYKLPKTHYIDAIMIASQGIYPTFKQDRILIKKCISKGDYQRTKGVRSEKKIPIGKIHGFRKFDKVLHKGTEYFIKGRMSTGYFMLMDITGNSIKLKPMAKFNTIKRISARKSVIMVEKHLKITV